MSTKRTIKLSEALERLKELTEKHAPMGLHRVSEPMLGGFTASWELGWGVDARLSVDTHHKDKAMALRVSVGWSSSTFSPAAARVAAVLHGQVTDLALLLEARIQAMPAVVEG